MTHGNRDIEDYDYCRPWYHGSPLELNVLRAGSSITQYHDLARAFSHRPTLVSLSVSSRDGEIGLQVTVKHNGSLPGFLYRIVDEIGPSDIHPHEACNPEVLEEWLTHREVRVEMICAATPRPEDLLSEDEEAGLMERIQTGE